MPAFAPLPSSRVQESLLSSKIGLDYFGPLQIKTKDGPRKTWVCLVTCLNQMEIHCRLAPWMGGAYERLVEVVKRSLRKSLGHKLLTLIQLQTLLKEVEATANSRPLVYVNDAINLNITLTPNHFLSLNPKIGIPETTKEDTDSDYSPYKNTSVKLLTIWKKGATCLKRILEDLERRVSDKPS
ncbi:uncharacterized protein LOC128550178 [Mercenaria mercenaria]|uniref:uncharacterized protein LOC128550178 n=1 Tax=Mercenaria mercenaria TaxID=6596 RepID=UPI00234F2F0B|nr:uncharacterized protein LOC128550178 [Mercenaria mercenaria]